MYSAIHFIYQNTHHLIDTFSCSVVFVLAEPIYNYNSNSLLTKLTHM